MREIKFRGKDCSGKWVYGDLIHKRHDKESVLIQDYTGLGSDVDTTTIGQYTGLKDKNGKEIYEGDIVRRKDLHRLGKVYFHQCAYRVDFGPCSYLLNIVLDEFDTSVIGNIHDNPELIEKKKNERML